MDVVMLRNLIGRLEPDTPLYRIVRLARLRKDLRAKRIGLVPTHTWEDPYENPLIRCGITYINERNRPQEFFDQKRMPTFAQCWSLTPESDTMWRAYSLLRKNPVTLARTSPIKEEGVKIRTRADKLLAVLWDACPANPEESCFLGEVRYMPQDQMMQYFADQVGRERLQAFAGGVGHAKSVLVKRDAFIAEREVRLIYVEHRPVGATERIFSIPIEPNDLFDEIILDPRLSYADVSARKREFSNLGFEGSVVKSQLYQNSLFEIIVE